MCPEDAEVCRNSAQSELAAAKARVVTARQQVSRTEVRAPFDGVASERKVSLGDTVQVGRTGQSSSTPPPCASRVRSRPTGW